MSDTDSSPRKYLFTFTLGAIAGGIIVAYATKAMPKIMSGMMRNMMSEMDDEGCIHLRYDRR